MRFIGNKELLTIEIKNLLEKKELLDSNLSFFDAFCGTGAVADSLKDSMNLIVNDMIEWSVGASLYAAQKHDNRVIMEVQSDME